MRRSLLAVLALALTATALPAADAAAKRLELVRIGSFNAPTYVTRPAGDTSRVYVVEQPGRIMVVKNGRKLARPFLDIRRRVRSVGEQGLLSMAFAPDYARSGVFYVDYTDVGGDTRVVAFRRSRNPDRADASRSRSVLFQDQPEANHNGGLILFGPDKRLYVGLGDGGGQGDEHGARGNGQNLDTLLGKILRIDPRPSASRGYRIPAGNPFAGPRRGRGEIWAYGLRNPWRFSFDRRTRAMVIGDVGGTEYEEVDYAGFSSSRGANWGWRVWEGPMRMTGESAPFARRPALAYRHDGRCAVTGGYVVRDRSLGSLYGSYLYGDYCDGKLRSARLRPGGASDRRVLRPRVQWLSSFGQMPNGRLYAVSSNGPVYRLVLR